MSLYTEYEAYNSAPDIEVLSVTGAEPIDELTALSWLRENPDLALDERIDISNLITECRAEIEQYLGFDIVQKSRRVLWHTYATVIDIPYGPHGAVSNVKRIYRGAETVLTADTDYYLSGLKFKKITVNRVFSTSSSQEYQLMLDVVSGYAVDKVPNDIIRALKLMLTNAYEYRGEHGESLVSMPGAAKDILKQHRRGVWL